MISIDWPQNPRCSSFPSFPVLFYPFNNQTIDITDPDKREPFYYSSYKSTTQTKKVQLYHYLAQNNLTEVLSNVLVTAKVCPK